MGYGRQKWHSFFSTIGRHLEYDDFIPGRYEMVCVGWHCAKVKGHAELIIETSRVKTLSYDFLKLHHSSPNCFGANVHLRKKKKKTVKVIERSRDVTPRSKVEKSKGRPRFPCAPNTVQFQPLFPELRHFEKMAHAIFLDRPPS